MIKGLHVRLSLHNPLNASFAFASRLLGDLDEFKNEGLLRSDPERTRTP
jgi:hypothetical protein